LEENLTFDFSFDVPGKIWQLAFDQNQGSIAIEIRDIETQSSSFLVFDLKTLDTTDFLIIEEADWWTTLVSINGNYLFLDKYADPQNPTSKSLVIYDWHKQTTVGEIEDFQMYGLDAKQIFGVQASDRNVESAIPLEELNMVFEDTIWEMEVHLPHFFASDSETFAMAKEYLQEEIAIGVEYYETGDFLSISYYVKAGSKFDRMLLVLKEECEILRITQDSSLEGFASGAFLVMNGYFIFIKQSNQINGIKI
jgi:hypothetical protein